MPSSSRSALSWSLLDSGVCEVQLPRNSLSQGSASSSCKASVASKVLSSGCQVVTMLPQSGHQDVNHELYTRKKQEFFIPVNLCCKQTPQRHPLFSRHETFGRRGRGGLKLWSRGVAGLAQWRPYSVWPAVCRIKKCSDDFAALFTCGSATRYMHWKLRQTGVAMQEEVHLDLSNKSFLSWLISTLVRFPDPLADGSGNLTKSTWEMRFT